MQTAVQGGQAALKAEGASRVECAWVHPSRVACTAGRNLVQCQLGGWGQPARVVLLHSRPEGDDFLGLVRPSQVPYPTCMHGIPCLILQMACSDIDPQAVADKNAGFFRVHIVLQPA